MSRANPRFHRHNAALPTLLFPAYQVVLSGVIDQQRWVTTLDYIANNTAQTTSSELNVATSALSTLGPALKALMAADVTLDVAKATCLSNNQRQPYTVGSSAIYGPGTGAANHIPSEMAVVISKYTPTKGQHGRGRNYVPGIPTTAVAPGTDANRITSAYQTTLATFTTQMLSTITDGATSLNLAIVQRVPGGANATLGQLVNQIIGRTLLGTVRRRRVGRGK